MTRFFHTTLATLFGVAMFVGAARAEEQKDPLAILWAKVCTPTTPAETKVCMWKQLIGPYVLVPAGDVETSIKEERDLRISECNQVANMLMQTGMAKYIADTGEAFKVARYECRKAAEKRT